MAEKKVIGTALFGAGRIGKIHFHDLFMNERASIEWVVDANIQFATNLVKKYGAEDRIKVCSNEESEQVYNDPKVDAVMVCTPTRTHNDIIVRALQKGKAVFSEKPLASSLEEVVKCYRLAKTRKLPLFCAFNRHFDPQYRQIFEKIQSNELGAVRMIKRCAFDPISMHTREYLFESASDGVFLDSVIHDIDLVCWLAGERPTSIYATGSRFLEVYKETKDYDTTAIIMTFPSGIIGMIQMVRGVHHGHDQSLEVIFEKGMLETANIREKSPILNTASGALVPPILMGLERYTDSYSAEVDYFLDVIEGKVKCEISAESTTLVVQLVEMCNRSAKTGQAIDFTKEAVINI